MKVAIIDYGAGNVRSLQFALERLGVNGILTANKATILSADKVIFPGQGAAGSAMEKLHTEGIDRLIPTLQQPVLGICLGMQLLCDHSEEGDTKGLGIIKGNVVRFSDHLKVPQMGWNSIRSLRSPLFDRIDEHSYMYLVHSYYVPILKDSIATTTYGIDYTVAVQKDNFYGVQFHPEKSSKAGQQLLTNFLAL